VIVVAMAGLVPTAAQADLSWSSSPIPLSPTGTNSSDVHVATDAAGDAVAVWLQDDSGVARVVEASRPAGSNFQTASINYISGVKAPDTLPSDTGAATADAPAISVNVAMNASGQAIVTWTQAPECGCNFYTYYEMAAPGGLFTGTPQLLVADSAVESVPALDAAGDAIVAYPEGQTLSAVYRAAGASTSFGSPQVVSGVIDGSYTVEEVTAPTLAMDGAGDALLAWHEMEFGGSPNLVRAAYRPAGASSPAFGSPATLSDPAANAENPSAAMDSSGNGAVAFDSSAGARTVQAAFRPKAQGSFGTTKTVSDAGVVSYQPKVAFGPGGDAFLAWAQYPPTPTPVLNTIEDAYAPAGQAFGSPQPVSTAGVNAYTANLGVDGQDRPAIDWTVSDTDGSNQFVQAASRVSGQGPFSTPLSLSGPGDFNETDTGTDDTDGPALSVSSSGQAVAVWQMVDPTSSSNLIYASIGTPPGVTPPPPPPPPPPPVPSAITADNSLQVGKPGVLTVKLTGNVQRVQWQIGDAQALDNVTPIGYGSQDSIRFSPTQRSFTVSVTAIGPSGSNTYSRAFTITKAATDADSVAVRSALSRTPAVYGVGDAQTLLGHTACGAVTVYSGKQQVSGCLRPINALTDIPAPERGAIQTMARDLGLNPNDAGLMSAAVQEVDGYVGPGPTNVAGKWPVVPNPGASVISFPGVGALTSSSASLDVGGIKFGGLSGGFSLNIDPSKLDIPLGSLPKPSLPDIGGFPLIGNWNIDLGTGDADIDTDLQLPSWLSIGGVPLHIPIKFKATPTGLVLDSLNIGPLNANLGPLNVTGLHLTYDRPSDTWTGSGKVCLLTGICLDMSPPNGEVKIVHGALNFAGATLDFPDPGVPLFTGVNLTSIGFGIGLDPTRLKANAGISVLDLVQLNGELIAAFPTADHPFVLARDEVGNDFPADLYGQPFHEPTIGAAADVLVNLPDLGYVKLGSGYLLYEVPDFIAVGGSADFTIPQVFELGGSIAGAANFSDHTLNLNAEIHACLLVITKICAKAVVDISKAPNDGGGAGGCVDVAGFHIGGGVLWKGFKIVVWPFDGCKWSRFKVDVRPTIASAAAATQTIRVKRGAPNPALKLYGHGAAPLVRVTGPGGQALDSTDKGFDYSPGGHIRILRYQGTTGDFTVVGLEHAKPGTYTVSAMPGSVPFTEIDSATDQPDAKITADITGTGERRLLTYRIRNRSDQTVTFWDTNPGGGATKIGHVNGGGNGQIHFAAPPGDRRRTIYAQFTLNGLPAERLTVAHYQPPAPTLAKPRGLRASRHGTRITVSWKPVPNATSYDVVLTDRITGSQRLTRTRRHTVVLTKVPLTVGGVLSVRAVEPKYARASLTSSATVKRLTAPRSHFRKLGHCKLTKHARKLTCTGGPPAPKHKAKHKHHKPKHHKKRKRRGR
jgi:hypothetical protein